LPMHKANRRDKGNRYGDDRRHDKINKAAKRIVFHG
jgi:hypothetical protein